MNSMSSGSLFPLGHTVVLTKRYSFHSKPQLHPLEHGVPWEYAAQQTVAECSAASLTAWNKNVYCAFASSV